MRNASLLPTPAKQVAPANESRIDRQSAPHIFRPDKFQIEKADSPGVLDELFNLRRRPGYYNAEAKAALLRLAKQAPHHELLVDFNSSQVQIALRASGIPLAIGDWMWHATANHQPLVSEGPWTAVCWQSEKAFDYLELELPLSSGSQVKRQMLLARDDRFLLLADALIGAEQEPFELRYSSSLPLAAEVNFCAARETREGWLQAGPRRQATIIAPSLAEWRSEFCHADLRAVGGSAEARLSLVLEQAALGRALYAPLWIDLDSRRLKRPVTWRRLTVAEDFAIVPRDIAAAYRVQAGRDQWLFYRSLAPPGNRSVLGYNTLKSFVCLRIVAGGKTETIIEVE